MADLGQAIELTRQALEVSPLDGPPYPTILSNPGAMLSEVGRREEALTVAMEAVAIRRRLAEENPAAYEPSLASALNNLGNRLSEVQRVGLCPERFANESKADTLTVQRDDGLGGSG